MVKKINIFNRIIKTVLTGIIIYLLSPVFSLITEYYLSSGQLTTGYNIGQSGLYTLVMFIFGFPLAIVFGKNRQFNSIFFSRNICKFGRRCAGIL